MIGVLSNTALDCFLPRLRLAVAMTRFAVSMAIGIEAANDYLIEVLLPAFTKRFSVKASDEGSAFIPWLDARTTHRC
jgi:hypothetical protein